MMPGREGTGVQLKVGTYAFDANSVRVASRSQQMLNEAHIPYAYRVYLSVSGFLTGSGQANLTSKQQALELALRVAYPDVILYHDDGSISSTAIRNAGSISGVIVSDGPNFP